VINALKTSVGKPERKKTFVTVQRGGRTILNGSKRVGIGFIWNRTTSNTCRL
jgi:hypothetical protein